MLSFTAKLSDDLHYSYSKQSKMYNSGIIGVCKAQHSIIQQAIDLIDALHKKFPKIHTIEQLAFSEVLRINKINIITCEHAVMHYWRSTLRKYMHHKLKKHFKDQKIYSPDRLLSTTKIPLSYMRAKLFKIFRKYDI